MHFGYRYGTVEFWVLWAVVLEMCAFLDWFYLEAKINFFELSCYCFVCSLEVVLYLFVC